jgi:hypothetical protein
MPSKNTVPVKSSGPAVLLGILITMLCLSLGAIALIVVFNANRPTSEELTLACKDQVGGAISAEYEKVTEQCKADAAASASATKSVAANGGRVGFTYPATWEVAIPHHPTASTDPLTEYASDRSIDLNILPLPPVVITISTKDAKVIANAGTFKDFVKTSVLANDPNGTVQEGIINNQKVVTATYRVAPGAPASGTYEDIYFEGPTTYALVSITSGTNTGGDGELVDAWKASIATIKGSLDFSSIQ